jgi:DNA-directed RNA polymerase III subunit RPC4
LKQKSSGYEGLYLFQFPSPFPTFLPKPSAAERSDVIEGDPLPSVSGSAKPLSSSEEEKPATAGPSGASASSDPEPKEQPNLEGVIGRLEVYRSGSVKMILGSGNELVLDVCRRAFLLFFLFPNILVLGKLSNRPFVSPTGGAP